MMCRRKVRASSRVYGTGTVVQRWLSGSWHCSTEPCDVVLDRGAQRHDAVGEHRDAG